MSEEKTEKTNSLLKRIDRRKYFKRINISVEKTNWNNLQDMV